MLATKLAANRRRSGLTLIELLVVTLIIGLLMALLMPAVMQARAAAHRVACASNLRQLGLAVHGYYADWQAFPMELQDLTKTKWPPSMSGDFIVCSSLVRLLPYLEQKALFDSVNFTLQYFSEYRPLGNPGNLTAMRTRLGVFLCPADGQPLGTAPGNNYRGNYGVGPSPWAEERSPESANGFLTFPATLTQADFRDGTSHTAAYSERLRGSDSTEMPVLSRDYYVLTYPYVKCPNSVITHSDHTLECCRLASSTGLPRIVDGGFSWYVASRIHTSYNHAQEPNGVIPDGLIPQYPTAWGMSTARSNHPGGVNVLTADGGVRFVANSIDRKVWRALGTRAEGDQVD
ncbi:MAG: DUF1559 domain-containing protein [Isosphaeraceae bacterium]|nr:DUF1559 domain-containing protein [Isosphaeraceae bacterium]